VVKIELCRSGKSVIWYDGFLPTLEDLANNIPKENHNNVHINKADRDLTFFNILNEKLIGKINSDSDLKKSNANCDTYLLKPQINPAFPDLYLPVHQECKINTNQRDDYAIIGSIFSSEAGNLIKNKLKGELDILGFCHRQSYEYQDLNKYKTYMHDISNIMIKMYVSPSTVFKDYLYNKNSINSINEILY